MQYVMWHRILDITAFEKNVQISKRGDLVLDVAS
jgi:hypothetical protein